MKTPSHQTTTTKIPIINITPEISFPKITLSYSVKHPGWNLTLQPSSWTQKDTQSIPYLQYKSIILKQSKTHNFSINIPESKCKFHQTQNPQWYCVTCFNYFCSECETTHEHPWTAFSNQEIPSSSSYLSELKQFKSMFFHNWLKAKNTILSRIEEAYSFNYTINTELFDYLNNLAETFDKYKPVNNYNLFLNMKAALELNRQWIEYNEDWSIDDNLGELLSYYESNFIIDIKPYETYEIVKKQKTTSECLCWCGIDSHTFSIGKVNGEVGIYLYPFLTKTMTIKDKDTKVCHVLSTNINRILSVYDRDVNIYVYNIKTGITEDILKGHTGRINKIIKYRNEALISCSDDTKIMIWDINKDSKKYEKVKTISNEIKCLNIVLLNNQINIVSGDNKEIKVWDWGAEQASVINRISIENNGNELNILQVSEDCLWINLNNFICVFSLKTGNEIRKLKDLKMENEFGRWSKCYQNEIWVYGNGTCLYDYDPTSYKRWTMIENEKTIKDVLEIETGVTIAIDSGIVVLANKQMKWMKALKKK